jgi:hypothetical protein
LRKAKLAASRWRDKMETARKSAGSPATKTFALGARAFRKISAIEGIEPESSTRTRNTFWGFQRTAASRREILPTSVADKLIAMRTKAADAGRWASKEEADRNDPTIPKER